MGWECHLKYWHQLEIINLLLHGSCQAGYMIWLDPPSDPVKYVLLSSSCKR